MRLRPDEPGAYRWFPVPALLLLLFAYLVPLSQVLVISVTDPEPGLGNYALLVTSPSIARVLATTARICAVTAAAALGWATSSPTA